MRKIGINLESIPDCPPAEFIAAAHDAGFDALFTCLRDKQTTLQVADTLSRYGMSYDTVHAPFSHINALWSEGEESEALMRELFDTVDACVLGGAPIAVIHLSTKKAPLVSEAGYRNLCRLVDYAASKNVTLAFENQRWLANLAFVFEYFDEAENVRFCWDCGHEECFARGRRYMPLFGDKLCCLHIHDNELEYNRDLHLLPFDGNIDFERVAAQIRDSGFEGTLMLECKGRKSGRYDHLSVPEFLQRAAVAARRLVTMIDK